MAFTDGDTEAWQVRRLSCLLPQKPSPPQLSSHWSWGHLFFPRSLRLEVLGPHCSLHNSHFSFIKVSSYEPGCGGGSNSLSCRDSD